VTSDVNGGRRRNLVRPREGYPVTWDERWELAGANGVQIPKIS
jgi:hypothetical protein